MRVFGHLARIVARCAVAGGLLCAVIAVRAVAEPPLAFCDDLLGGDCDGENPYAERIETERHDFTQSAITVGRGVVQLEGGYTFFTHDDGGETETAHTLPELLLRLGLTEDIEFRLRWNYVWVALEDGPDERGAEDLRWSFKLQVTEQECRGLVPTSALEIRSTAPTGGEAWTTERVEFGLDYIYQWDLTERLNVAGSTGFVTNGFGDFGLLPDEPARDQFLVLSQSAVVGFEVSESNSMYVEWYGIFSRGLADELVVSVFNVGVDHYVTNNFVVDVRAGSLGTDRHSMLLGTPAVQLPSVMPGIPTSLPEIALMKKSDQRGVAKIAVFAYSRITGRALWQSGTVEAESRAKDTWVFGAGPFSRGSIRRRTELAGEPLPRTPDDVDLTTLIPAFALSELRAAFIIGFVIYIPFLIIDMVVSAALMSLGMMMLPPVTVSLPFKMLLFVLVNGWGLIVTALVASYK